MKDYMLTFSQAFNTPECPHTVTRLSNTVAGSDQNVSLVRTSVVGSAGPATEIQHQYANTIHEVILSVPETSKMLNAC